MQNLPVQEMWLIIHDIHEWVRIRVFKAITITDELIGFIPFIPGKIKRDARIWRFPVECRRREKCQESGKKSCFDNWRKLKPISIPIKAESDLGYVEEDGQTGDGQHVAEQEAAVTHPGIAIVVMMSQTHSLKGISLFRKCLQSYREPNLVSFNGDSNCEEDAASQTDVGQTIKDGVESQEDVGGEVQGDGGQHHAAHQEGCVRQAEAREQGGENSLCFPEKNVDWI